MGIQCVCSLFDVPLLGGPPLCPADEHWLVLVFDVDAVLALVVVQVGDVLFRGKRREQEFQKKNYAVSPLPCCS